MFLVLVCILKRFIACEAVELLAGAGEGTLFSHLESGGGGLFDDFANMLDGFCMADRLEVCVEVTLRLEIIVACLAGKPSSISGLISHLTSDLVDTAWILG